MANGIDSQLGLYGTFQKWLVEAQIPDKEIDRNADGKIDRKEIIGYVLEHFDKFSTQVQKHLQNLQQSFRALGFSDEEARSLLTGETAAGAKRLVEKGKEFEERAKQAKAAGKHKEATALTNNAEKSYRLALVLESKDSHAHRALADLLYRKGECKDGREHAVQAIQNADTKEVSGLLKWAEGLKDEAIRKAKPLNFVAVQLAEVKRYDEAKKLYTDAAKEAEARGDTKAAEAFRLKELWIIDGQYYPDFGNSQAHKLYMALKKEGIPSALISKDFKIAETTVFSYVDSHLEDPRVQAALKDVGLGKLPWAPQKGKVPPEYATPEFEKLSFSQKWSFYHLQQAKAAKGLEARQHELITAIEFDPKSAARVTALADFLLLEKKEPGVASFYYKRALELDPNSVDAKLGMARVAVSEGDLDKALSFFRQPGVKAKAPEEALPVFRNNYERAWANYQIKVQSGEIANDPAAMLELWKAAEDFRGVSAADPAERFADLKLMKQALDAHEYVSQYHGYSSYSKKGDIGVGEDHLGGLRGEYSKGFEDLFALLKNPPADTAWDKKLSYAKMAYQIDRDSKDPDVLQKDLKAWSDLVQSAPSSVIDDATKADQYAQIFNGWLEVRKMVPKPEWDYLSSRKEPEDPVRDAMYEVASRIQAVQGARGKDNNLYTLFNDIIKEENPALLQFISGKGLDDYYETRELAYKTLYQGYGEKDPKKSQALIFQALALYASVHDTGKAYELAENLYKSLPQDATDADRMKLCLKLDQALAALHPAQSGIDIKKVVARREAELATKIYLQAITQPDHGKRVQDLLLVKAYLQTAQEKPADLELMVNGALQSEVDTMTAALMPTPLTPETTPLTGQQRVEYAGYIVLVDQALVSEYPKGDDAKKSFGELKLAHLKLLQAELDSHPELPLAVRLEAGKRLAQTTLSYDAYRTGDKRLFTYDELSDLRKSIETSMGPILDAAMKSPEIEVWFQGFPKDYADKLRERCATDVKYLFHDAMVQGNPGVVAQFNVANISQFVEGAQSAHALLLEAGDSKNPNAMKLRLEAGQLFAQMGLKDRVREAWGDLVFDAQMIPDLKQRQTVLLQWAAAYQQAGMKYDANYVFDRVAEMDVAGNPKEIRDTAKVAAAMKLLNNDDRAGAEAILKDLPDNKMAQDLRLGFNLERKHKRESTVLGILRAEVEAKFKGEQKTAALARLDDIQRMLMTGEAKDLKDAFNKTGSYVGYGATTGISGVFNVFWDSGSYNSYWDYFITNASNPNLSDKEFSGFLLGVANRCIDTTAAENKDYTSATIVSQFLFDDPYYGSEAKKLHDSVPDKARSNARWAMLRNASIIFADSEEEAIKSAALWLIPFGAGAVVGRVARAGWVLWATEGAGAGLELSSLAVRGIGFGIQVTSETGTIVLANMTLESVFTQSLDNWSWKHLGKEGLSMLLVMVLSHGVGAGMGQLGKKMEGVSWLGVAEKEAVQLRQAGKLALNPAARAGFQVLSYSSRVGSFAGIGYLGEVVGLHEKSGRGAMEHLLDSAIMDAQMILAKKVVGGALAKEQVVENPDGTVTVKKVDGLDAMDHLNAKRVEGYRLRLASKELLPVVEGMGLDVQSQEGRIVYNALMAEVAGGQGADKVAARWKAKDVQGYREVVREQLRINPESREGKQMLALLIAYAHGPGRTKPGDPPMSAKELGRAAEEMRTQIKLLVKEAGGGDGPQAKALVNTLLGMALSRGIGPDALAKYAEAAPKYRQALQPMMEGLLGKDGAHSKTGERLINELLGRAVLQGMLRGDSPDQVAKDLGQWQKSISQSGDSLRKTVDGLFGEGFSKTAQGKDWLGQLLVFGLANADSPAQFNAFLGQLQTQAPELRKALADAVDTAFWVGASKAEGSTERSAAMLFAVMNGSTKPEEWGPQLQKFSEGFRDLSILINLKQGKPHDALLQWMLRSGYDLNQMNGLIDAVKNRQVVLKVGADGEVKIVPYEEPKIPEQPAATSKPKPQPAPDATAAKSADSQGDTTKVSKPKPQPAPDTAAAPPIPGQEPQMDSQGGTKVGGRGRKGKIPAPAADSTPTDVLPMAAKGEGGEGVPGRVTGSGGTRAEEPTRVGTGEASDTGPTERDAPKAGFFLTSDGLDSFSVAQGQEKSVLWSSKDAGIPGKAWKVEIKPLGDGEFVIIPLEGDIAIQSGTRWDPATQKNIPLFGPVSRGGTTLADNMMLRFGDVEITYRKPSADAARDLATGSRQAEENIAGNLLEYYAGPHERATLDIFAKRQDAWGEQARLFQEGMKELESKLAEYRKLEADYRKDPSLDKRKTLNDKWAEVESASSALHASRYHLMERNHTWSIQARQVELQPLEVFFGLQEVQAYDKAEGRSSVVFHLDYKSPEMLPGKEGNFNQVATKDFVTGKVEVSDWKTADKLMEAMKSHEGLQITEPLKIDADGKTAKAVVTVDGKTPITLEFSLTEKVEVAQDREARIRADIRVDYETLAMLNGDIQEMKRNLEASKTEKDPGKIEAMKKSGEYVEPAKVAEQEAKIAEYEKILAEAKGTFEATLKAQRRTAGGIPYAEATTAQIGSRNMPEGAGVAAFKPITEIQGKTQKIADAKPSPERIERYVKYLVEKKKMSRADAEVLAQVWAEQVIADARAYQAGRTHIYDTSLPAKPETAHMDAATVDHHGRFANPKNSTEQLIGKMEASLEVVKGDREALDAAAKDAGAMDAARRGLREAGVKKPTEQQVTEIAAAIRELNLKEVTTDNLADGAWSVWIAKNQARILADPALRKRVEAATHFEDFTAFGTEYNPKDPGVRLQAALFQEYGKILKDNGIIGSDRFPPDKAQKVMGEALTAIDQMVFNDRAAEAAAAEFFGQVEAARQAVLEKGLMKDVSVTQGDTQLIFVDLTKLGNFTVFQQWLAIPQAEAVSGKPHSMQVSVVPLGKAKAKDGTATELPITLQIVAIPNGRSLPSGKSMLDVLPKINAAELAKAEALGLVPKEGEAPKPGQYSREEYSKIWFGKENVILPKADPKMPPAGTLLTPKEVSEILTDSGAETTKLGLFEKAKISPEISKLPPKTQQLIDLFSAPYEVSGHWIEADIKPIVDLVNKVGPKKIEAILERGEVSSENLSRLLDMATNENFPDKAAAVRHFLERASAEEIAFLTDSKPQMIDRIVNFKFHVDGKTVTGLDLLVMDNPYPALEVITGKSAYPEMEARLLGAMALREFHQSTHSEAGLEFLAMFGVDPRTHDHFPWNEADTIDRAKLYIEVSQYRRRIVADYQAAFPNLPKETIDAFVNDLWKTLRTQDVQDTHLPYTPHGWKHSLTVMEDSAKIFDQAGPVRETIIAQLRPKYGDRAEVVARELVKFIGIFHDTGYGCLHPHEHKGVHAQRSGELFKRQFTEHMDKVFGIKADDPLFNEIFLAIERHGADKPGKAEYMRASDKENPFLFVIRLADNLDLTNRRMRQIQLNQPVMAAAKEMYRLGESAEFKALSGPEQKREVQKIRDKYVQHFQNEVKAGRMKAGEAKRNIKLLEHLNESTYPHFAGMEKVIGYQLIEDPNTHQLTVEIQMSGWAAGQTVSDAGYLVDHPLYQLLRTYIAGQSMSYGTGPDGRGLPLEFRYRETFRATTPDGHDLPLIPDNVVEFKPTKKGEASKPAKVKQEGVGILEANDLPAAADLRVPEPPLRLGKDAPKSSSDTSVQGVFDTGDRSLPGAVLVPHQEGVTAYPFTGYKKLGVLEVDTAHGVIKLQQEGNPETLRFQYDVNNPPEFVKGLKPGDSVDVLHGGGGSAFPPKGKPAQAVGDDPRVLRASDPKDLGLGDIEIHAPVGKNVFTFGRNGAVVDVAMNDGAVSKVHATFYRTEDGQWWVMDGAMGAGNHQVQSRNGLTKVGADGHETPVTREGWEPITPGQRLKIGNHYFVFQPGEAAGTKPAPMTTEDATAPNAPSQQGTAANPDAPQTVLTSHGSGETPLTDWTSVAGSLEQNLIPLSQLAPNVEELNLFVGDPAKLDARADLGVVVDDGANRGSATFWGKLRREGDHWLYYPAEHAEAQPVRDALFGNKVPRPDGWIEIGEGDRISVGFADFQIRNGEIVHTDDLGALSVKTSLHYPAELPAVARVGDVTATVVQPVMTHQFALADATLLAGNVDFRDPIPVTVLPAESDRGSIAMATTQGKGYSKANEDSLLTVRGPRGETIILDVDGMGGHGNGDAAALLVSEAFASEIPRSGDTETAWQLANAAVRRFNGALEEGYNRDQALDAARQLIADPASHIDKGMAAGAGAVAVQLKIEPPARPGDPHVAHFEWIGDARGVILRKDGQGRWQLGYRTVDEGVPTYPGMLVPGQDYEVGGGRRTLAMAVHPMANRVTNSLGTEARADPQLTQHGEIPNPSDPTGASPAGDRFSQGIALREGDLVILGSDGLWENFASTKALLELIKDAKSSEDVTRILTDEAHWRMDTLSRAKKGMLPEEIPGLYRIDRPEGIVYTDLQGNVKRAKTLYIDEAGNVYDSPNADRPVDHYKNDNFSMATYWHQTAAETPRVLNAPDPKDIGLPGKDTRTPQAPALDPKAVADAKGFDAKLGERRQRLSEKAKGLGEVQGTAKKYAPDEIEELLHQTLERGQPLELVTTGKGLRDAVDEYMVAYVNEFQNAYPKEIEAAKNRNPYTGESFVSRNQQGKEVQRYDALYRFARMRMNEKLGQPIFGEPSFRQKVLVENFVARALKKDGSSYEKAKESLRDEALNLSEDFQKAFLAAPPHLRVYLVSALVEDGWSIPVSNPDAAMRLVQFIGKAGLDREMGVAVDFSGEPPKYSLVVGNWDQISHPDNKNVYLPIHSHTKFYLNQRGKVMGVQDTMVTAVGKEIKRSATVLPSDADLGYMGEFANDLAKRGKDVPPIYDAASKTLKGWVQHPYGIAEIRMQVDGMGNVIHVQVDYGFYDPKHVDTTHGDRAKALQTWLGKKFPKAKAKAEFKNVEIGGLEQGMPGRKAAATKESEPAAVPSRVGITGAPSKNQNSPPPAMDPHTAVDLPDFANRTAQQAFGAFPKSLRRNHLSVILAKSEASGLEFASLAIEVDGKMVTTGENYLTSHAKTHVDGQDHYRLFQQAASDLPTEGGISPSGTLRIYDFHTHPTRIGPSLLIRSVNSVHEDGRPYTMTNDNDWKSFQDQFRLYVQELRKSGWTGPIEMVAGALPAQNADSGASLDPTLAKEPYVTVTTLRVEAGQYY